MAACGSMEEGLVWDADGWDASLGLHSAVVQVIRAAAPKIIWYARFLYRSALNFQSLWRLVDSNNGCGFSAASKTTTALLKTRLNHMYSKFIQHMPKKFIHLHHSWFPSLSDQLGIKKKKRKVSIKVKLWSLPKEIKNSRKPNDKFLILIWNLPPKHRKSSLY